MIAKIARALSALAVALTVLLGGTVALGQAEAAAAPRSGNSRPHVDKDSSAGKMKRVEKKRKPSSKPIKPWKYERKVRHSAKSTQRPVSAPCSVVNHNARGAGLLACTR